MIGGPGHLSGGKGEEVNCHMDIEFSTCFPQLTEHSEQYPEILILLLSTLYKRGKKGGTRSVGGDA